MRQLKKIRIKNFKIFTDSEFEFSALNCFTGCNNSGKSTVFKALDLLERSFTKHGFERLDLRSNEDFSNFVNNETGSNKIEFELTFRPMDKIFHNLMDTNWSINLVYNKTTLEKLTISIPAENFSESWVYQYNQKQGYQFNTKLILKSLIKDYHVSDISDSLINNFLDIEFLAGEKILLGSDVEKNILGSILSSKGVNFFHHLNDDVEDVRDELLTFIEKQEEILPTDEQRLSFLYQLRDYLIEKEGSLSFYTLLDEMSVEFFYIGYLPALAFMKGHWYLIDEIIDTYNGIKEDYRKLTLEESIGVKLVNLKGINELVADHIINFVNALNPENLIQVFFATQKGKHAKASYDLQEQNYFSKVLHNFIGESKTNIEYQFKEFCLEKKYKILSDPAEKVFARLFDKSLNKEPDNNVNVHAYQKEFEEHIINDFKKQNVDFLDYFLQTYRFNSSKFIFIDKWLKRFGIADGLYIKTFDFPSAQIFLHKDGVVTNIVDAGYGVTQFIYILLSLFKDDIHYRESIDDRYFQTNNYDEIKFECYFSQINMYSKYSPFQRELISEKFEHFKPEFLPFKSYSYNQYFHLLPNTNQMVVAISVPYNGKIYIDPYYEDEEISSKKAFEIEKKRYENENWVFRPADFNGSFLIYEEPESNLHPKFQSKLAELFFDIIKHFNVTILIETHSEYLIRKFQYLVNQEVIHSNDIQLFYLYEKGSLNSEHANFVKKINIEKNGQLSSPFGSGFLDEADNISMLLFAAQKGLN